MTNRLPCTRCGESIHPDTAAKNGGLCMPCKGGYRERIEEGKRQREQERAYEKSEERKYWRNLVQRVQESPAGFDGLTEPEKLYYSVSCLIGEVYNGGFDQFFHNSSGSLYGRTLAGLYELEAENSAGLLIQAKEILFESGPVPINQEERFYLMSHATAELETLDSAFYKDSDNLADRCKAYAIEHNLYANG